MGKRAKTRSRIVNKDEVLEKKRQRRLLIVGSFLVFLMIFSVFGVMLYNDYEEGNSKITLGDFIFTLKNQENDYYWELVKAPKEKEMYEGSYFFNAPDQLPLNIYASERKDIFSQIVDANFIYVVVDTEKLVKTGVNITSEKTTFTEDQLDAIRSVQFQEYSRGVLADVFNKKNIISLSASTNYTEIFGDEVIDCDNATISSPVLKMNYVEDGEEGFIVTSDNCITVQSSLPENFLKYVESFKLDLIMGDVLYE